MSGSIPLKSFDEQRKFRAFAARDGQGRSQGQAEQEFETRPSSSTTFEDEDCEKGEIRSHRSSVCCYIAGRVDVSDNNDQRGIAL